MCTLSRIVFNVVTIQAVFREALFITITTVVIQLPRSTTGHSWACKAIGRPIPSARPTSILRNLRHRCFFWSNKNRFAEERLWNSRRTADWESAYQLNGSTKRFRRFGSFGDRVTSLGQRDFKPVAVQDPVCQESYRCSQGPMMGLPSGCALAQVPKPFPGETQVLWLPLHPEHDLPPFV